jgi:hypothetical protein
MEIRIERRWRGENTTLGTLKVNGAPSGFVLEDKDRGLSSSTPLSEISREKVHGRTAIPAGRYRVDVTYSNRFKRRMPVLLNVPGFAGIRIHAGNVHTDTEGCPLPGKTYILENGDYKVLSSRQVTDKLEDQINAALKAREEVFCTIVQLF